MKNLIRVVMLALGVVALLSRCSENNLNLKSDSATASALSIAQTSGQLASGTSFVIQGVQIDSTVQGSDGHQGGPSHHGGKKSGKGKHTAIDALTLLAPTEELLAIIDAESAGDLRGMRIFGRSGATITNYDVDGNVISLPTPADGPQGCSFSGKQYPALDSLLALIARTEIDFGTGVTHDHDSITITRTGKIVITRSGDESQNTETITFQGYSVNGITIEGTKTRTYTYNATTGQGTSITHVDNGKITFADGTVATWTSDRQRVSTITLNDNGKPESGTIVTDGSTIIAASDGITIYSHVITSSLVEDVSCHRRHRGPVRGIVDTHYRNNAITIDFGSGTCEDQTITVTINGVTTTKQAGD